MNTLGFKQLILQRPAVWGSLLSLGMVLGAGSGVWLSRAEAIATLPPPEQAAPQSHAPTAPGSPDYGHEYRQIEQPLSHKLIVSLGGLALMLAELWWFLLSQPTTPRPITPAPPSDSAAANEEQP